MGVHLERMNWQGVRGQLLASEPSGVPAIANPRRVGPLASPGFSWLRPTLLSLSHRGSRAEGLAVSWAVALVVIWTRSLPSLGSPFEFAEGPP